MTAIGLGNRCGHQKDDPTRYKHPRMHKRPEILSRLKFRVHSYNRTDLGYKNFFKRLKAARHTLLKTDRQQRSEARHGCSWLMGVISDLVDLETMCLGYWGTDGRFHAYTIEKLHAVIQEAIPTNDQGEKTENYSFRRLCRHLRLLKKAGYIRSRRRRYDTMELDEDGNPIYREDISLKFVTTRLFVDAGMTKEELKESRKASEKRNSKLRKAAGVVFNTLSEWLDQSSKGDVRKHYEAKAEQKKAEAEQRGKILKAQAAKLKEAVNAWNDRVVYYVTQLGMSMPDAKAKAGPRPT